MSNRPSAPRTLLFVTILGCVVFAGIETAARLIFAARVGPSALTYGFRSGQTLENVGNDAHKRRTLEGAGRSYVKYAPHQIRFDSNPRTGERFRVAINSRGLRGGEYTDEKAPGTVRVVTLGASSTFGYYNREETTYPVLLEELLNGECAGEQRFQVINLGIPHLRSEEILAILEHEGLRLSPDVVTFYEGVNDAVEVRTAGEDPVASPAETSSSLPRAIYRFLRARFISVAFTDSVLRGGKNRTFSAEEVEAHFAGKVEHWLDSLEGIRRLCEEHGIRLVVASQQSKAEAVPDDAIRGVTYRDELEIVKSLLASGRRLNVWERAFLVHAEMMVATERWARRNGVPFVDVVAATDARRDVLLSWVHLTPEGNRLVARAFADTLLEIACPPRATAAPAVSRAATGS